MPSDFELLKAVFDRDVCQRATAPLKKGTQIAVLLSNGEQKVRLRRTPEGTLTEKEPAEKPDMTFQVPTGALEALHAFQGEDIGEVGVEILKLMVAPEPEKKIKARVHIGPFALFTQGYLGILPLGGPTVMKFLASKGLTNIGKIKDALSKLRD